MRQIVGWTRHATLGIAVAALALLVPAPGRAQENISKEYQIKAAYLSKFMNFIEWRSPRLRGTKRVICLLGGSPFGSYIERLAKAHGIEVEVKTDWEPSKDEICHLIYVGASERHRLPELFPLLEQTDAVTVSDIPGFAEMGGTIEFVIESRHVRFIINQASSMREGYRISSQLLALAKQLVSIDETDIRHTYRA